jgi:hypothetical protein
MHKTGTTSFQRFLASNGEQLLNAGVFCGGPFFLHDSALGREPHVANVVAAAAALVETGERRGAHAVVISHEGFSGWSPAEWRALSDRLGDRELRIVFTFRHWSGFLPSRWAQNCRRRDTQGFADYLAMIADPGAKHIDWRFDLVPANATAGAPAAEIAAVSYDAAIRDDGSIVPALARAVEIPATVGASLDEGSARSNARDDWRTTELTRLLNGVVASRRGLPQNALCAAVRDFDRCATRFDFGSRIAALPLSIRAPLEALIENERTEFSREIPGVATMVEALHPYRALFANVHGGEALPASPVAHVRTSSLTWERLLEREPYLTEQAYEALSG